VEGMGRWKKMDGSGRSFKKGRNAEEMGQ